MSVLVYILASVVMALIVLGGLLLIMGAASADDAIDKCIRAKRELDSDRKEFEQKATKETKEARASLPSFPAVKKNGGAEP